MLAWFSITWYVVYIDQSDKVWCEFLENSLVNHQLLNSQHIFIRGPSQFSSQRCVIGLSWWPVWKFTMDPFEDAFVYWKCGISIVCVNSSSRSRIILVIDVDRNKILTWDVQVFLANNGRNSTDQIQSQARHQWRRYCGVLMWRFRVRGTQGTHRNSSRPVHRRFGKFLLSIFIHFVPGFVLSMFFFELLFCSQFVCGKVGLLPSLKLR